MELVQAFCEIKKDSGPTLSMSAGSCEAMADAGSMLETVEVPRLGVCYMKFAIKRRSTFSVQQPVLVGCDKGRGVLHSIESVYQSSSALDFHDTTCV